MENGVKNGSLTNGSSVVMNGTSVMANGTSVVMNGTSVVSRKKTKGKYTVKDVLQHNKREDCWIIINKKVYDVTKWVPYHPGGIEIMVNLAGRDATDLFNHMHPKETANKLPAFYIGDIIDYEESDFVREFRDLSDEVEKEGYYVTSYWWYFYKTMLCYLMLACAVTCYYLGYDMKSSGLQLLGAFILAVYFQQVAFLGHDAGHNGITHVRLYDTLYGIMVGPMMTGISMAWWKHSHNVHHAVPNVVQYDPDIQHLPVFAVTSKYFKSLYSFYHHRVMSFDKVSRFIVSYQHILFYPVMGLARFNLYAQSAILIIAKVCEWRKAEAFATIFFWIWVVTLHSYCLSWKVAIACLLISHGFAGILHVQICLSHFALGLFDDVTYRNDDEQYVDTQLKTTMDIDNPWYMDWFHGGLQFQTTHHIFPRVPRHNLRRLSLKVRAFCEKYGRKYYAETFWDANVKTLICLKKAALDARKGKFVNFQGSMIWEGFNAHG